MEDHDTTELRKRAAEATAAYRSSPEYYSEPWRPQFHFTPERNWMNDPNGLVFDGKQYHLFYQHNPFGNDWGHMSWGHATSPDLLHWTHLPVALWEESGESIFSGSAVVDPRNDAGFASGDATPLVAAYTSERPYHQTQSLASSTDGGCTWRKYQQNPVLDIREADFRDPRLLWHEATESWVMAVALAKKCKLLFYRSSDLKSWTLASEFGPIGITGKGTWECPELLQLDVLDAHGRGGSQSRWLLKVDVDRRATAGRCGGEYFLGEFDGYRFHVQPPDREPVRVDHGSDFFAAQCWSGPLPAGRPPVWIGWMGSWDAPKTPTAPWRHALTVPRTLALRETPAGIRLAQWPVPELEHLRGELIDGRSHPVQGRQLDLEIEVAISGEQPVELRVHRGESEETVIRFDPVAAELAIDRRRSGTVDFDPAFAGEYRAPLSIADGVLHLRVLVDRSSVEVFANKGLFASTVCVFPSEGSDQVLLSANGSSVKRFDAWPMKSVWRP